MKKIILIACISLLVVSCGNTKKSYSNLTSCLQNNKVVMFGASWCPHCAEQKKLFLKSVKDLPYFECAVGNGQDPECEKRGISSYPTWQFPDTSIQSLPQDSLKALLNSEIAKVKSTTDMYSKAASENKPELRAVVDKFSQKMEALIASNSSDYEKLLKLTLLSEGPDETLIERPVYMSGRLAGERSLTEIALYAGCSDAYQMDITATEV